MAATGARHDQDLLCSPADLEAQDELRLERIKEEIDRGFDALRDVDDGVSVFGSARVGEGHRAGTSSAARRRPASRATGSR